MRLIHCADLHLGFHAYTRLTKTGINQREADVAGTFTRAIDLIIERAPDLVIIAGDIFHSVKPGNHAILHAFTQFGRLRQSLPETIVVMVAGNHDTPRTSDTGSILPLFRELGIHVADSVPQRYDFLNENLSVLAVPDAMHARPTFAPVSYCRYNVCVAHLEVAGLIPGKGVQQQRKDLEVPLEELATQDFTYVGVGHYHVYRELAANACYSGSIDYTSTNPWGELEEERAAGLLGKGLVEVDLETGRRRHHYLAPARPLIDLPIIEASGMSPRDLDDAIAANAASVTIEGAVVRQRVHGVPLTVDRELDQQALRALKAKAAHFNLAKHKQEPVESDVLPIRKRQTVNELLVDRLATRELPSDIDRGALTTLATGYLADAEAMEAQRRPERAIEPTLHEEVA